MSPNSRNAFMAGLMEGEGSFSISKVGKHFALNVRFYNTNKKLIDWVISNYGGSPSWGNKHGGNLLDQTNKKPICQWFITGKSKMELFLLAIIPYLIGKRRQAEIALEYVRMNGKHDPDKRQRMADEMSSLNRFLTSDTPTTNTQDDSEESKIEPALIGDYERVAVVTQTILNTTV